MKVAHVLSCRKVHRYRRVIISREVSYRGVLVYSCALRSSHTVMELQGNPMGEEVVALIESKL